MNQNLSHIKPGLLLVLLTLLWGLSLGITFGIKEDAVKSYISQGIKAKPAVHDKKSQGKIWRYAQRSHFHATGISAFSLGLLLLLMVTRMKAGLKKITSLLIGLGGLYPLSWFSMFLLSPSLGRGAAHHHYITELFTYIGVGGLMTGLLLLCANLFLGFANKK